MAQEAKFVCEFARGDSYLKGVQLMQSGQPAEETFDDVYFTVKKYYTDTDFVFQKRMSTGGIVDDGDGHYTLSIDPDDTNNMAFGDYDCDFEFRKTDDDFKRTFYGKLKLTKEVTHVNNE